MNRRPAAVAASLFCTSGSEHRGALGIEVTASTWHHHSALARAFQRVAVAEMSHTLGAQARLSEMERERADQISYGTWRFWWAPPNWRDDRKSGSAAYPDVAIVRDKGAMYFDGAQQLLLTNEELSDASDFRKIRLPTAVRQLPTVARRRAVFPLFGMAFASQEWAFETIGTAMMLGSETRHVRIVRRSRKPEHDPVGATDLHPGVDEYTCMADDALQMLLLLDGFVDNSLAVHYQDTELRTGIDIPLDVFEFTPPAGSSVATVVDWPDWP